MVEPSPFSIPRDSDWDKPAEGLRFNLTVYSTSRPATTKGRKESLRMKV